jgi:3-(3-hydroxy-phenyl)propionate hydroxylase
MGAKTLGQIVGELDLDLARQRDIKLRGQLERGEVVTSRQGLIPDLANGVIDRGHGGGTLFVQPRVANDLCGDVLLDDLLGGGFLLASQSPEPQGWLKPRSLATWSRIGGERMVIRQDRQVLSKITTGVRDFTERDGLFAGWMRRHAGKAVIVRPDRYVFGVASDAPELNRMIDSLGALFFD